MTRPVSDLEPVAGQAAEWASTLISAEHATVGTEWVVSGRVRLRRQVITETQSIDVVLRREELLVETMDVGAVQNEDAVWRGCAVDGPAIGEPGGAAVVRIVLRREVPDISTHIEPYELVTPLFRWQTEHVPVSVAVRREQAGVETVDAAADGPTAAQ